jgi:CBS domain-containing protein
MRGSGKPAELRDFQASRGILNRVEEIRGTDLEMRKVKDLMIPLDKYATVFEEASLFEAVVALEESHSKFGKGTYPHRAVLVYDKEQQIVGKVSLLDVLRGLEPRYEEIVDSKGVARASSRFGLAPEFVKSLIKKYGLWQKPLEDICGKADRIRVRDIMRTPTEGEYVREEASVNEAIHLLIMGQHQSLLVARDKEIVGILRLSDVFEEICKIMKQCEL